MPEAARDLVVPAALRQPLKVSAMHHLLTGPLYQTFEGLQIRACYLPQCQRHCRHVLKAGPGAVPGPLARPAEDC